MTTLALNNFADDARIDVVPFDPEEANVHARLMALGLTRVPTTHDLAMGILEKAAEQFNLFVARAKHEVYANPLCHEFFWTAVRNGLRRECSGWKSMRRVVTVMREDYGVALPIRGGERRVKERNER